MAANVETMMYVREKPWHGLGTMVQEAPTSADALKFAGLDWNVLSQPIFDEEQNPITGYKLNVRSTDGAHLGLVTNAYQICQNTEAFQFTDSLIGGEVHYETAGSLRGGKQVWLLAKLGKSTLAGDDTENYLVFSNSHDGTGAIRVAVTPVRVVCNNTLNLALNSAVRAWSTRHMGDLQQKMQEAEDTLLRANHYIDELALQADQMANTPISEEQLNEILDDLFPIKDDDTDRVKANKQRMKNEFMYCYFAPDIKKFMGTQWGAINAMSDLVGHTQPIRKTKNYAENNFSRIINGHYLVDTMMKLMQKAAK